MRIFIYIFDYKQKLARIKSCQYRKNNQIKAEERFKMNKRKLMQNIPKSNNGTLKKIQISVVFKVLIFLFGQQNLTGKSDKQCLSATKFFIYNYLVKKKMETLFKYLQDDLKKQKKKQLEKILKFLDLPVHANHKKQKHMADFCQKVYQLLNNNKRNGIPQDFTISQICERISRQYPQLANDLKKKLTLYINALTNNTCQNYNYPFPGSYGVNHFPPQMTSVFKRSLNTSAPSSVENLVLRPKCVCSNMYLLDNSIYCFICKRSFHKACMKPVEGEVFQCPFCYIALMDPMNEVKDCIFLGYLRTDVKVHKIQFNLKQSDFMNTNIHVQIRCLRLDGKNNYELTWPDFGDLRVNDTKICDFKPLVYNSSLKRRRDQSKVIDKKLLRGGNCIQVTQYMAQTRDQLRIGNYLHFIGIFLVYQHPVDIFTKQISNIFLQQQQSRQLLQKQFDSLDEIQVQRLDISLKCVFQFVKIRIPVRSKYCTHFQCFDLQNMIKVTAKTQPRRWRCPICRKKAHLLLVDPILTKILQDNISRRISQVSFCKDGTIKLIQQKQQEQQSESPTLKIKESKKQSNLILLDDDVEQIRKSIVELNQIPTNIIDNKDQQNFGIGGTNQQQQQKKLKQYQKNIKKPIAQFYGNFRQKNPQNQDQIQKNTQAPTINQSINYPLSNLQKFPHHSLKTYYFNKLFQANHSYPTFADSRFPQNQYLENHIPNPIINSDPLNYTSHPLIPNNPLRASETIMSSQPFSSTPTLPNLINHQQLINPIIPNISSELFSNGNIQPMLSKSSYSTTQINNPTNLHHIGGINNQISYPNSNINTGSNPPNSTFIQNSNLRPYSSSHINLPIPPSQSTPQQPIAAMINNSNISSIPNINTFTNPSQNISNNPNLANISNIPVNNLANLSSSMPNSLFNHMLTNMPNISNLPNLSVVSNIPVSNISSNNSQTLSTHITNTINQRTRVSMNNQIYDKQKLAWKQKMTKDVNNLPKHRAVKQVYNNPSLLKKIVPVQKKKEIIQILDSDEEIVQKPTGSRLQDQRTLLQKLNSKYLEETKIITDEQKEQLVKILNQYF